MKELMNGSVQLITVLREGNVRCEFFHGCNWKPSREVSAKSRTVPAVNGKLRYYAAIQV